MYSVYHVFGPEIVQFIAGDDDGDDVRGCYDPILVVANCWELV